MSDDASTTEREGGRLDQALEVLERSLEAPVVPGETELRAEGVRSAVDEARDAFGERARHEHPRTLREIGDTDPALLHRVDRMKEDARELAGRWQRAANDARALCAAAAARPRDETVFRERFEEYAPQALALVLKTRAHEVALRTWTHEAFQRDRGGGD